MMNLTVLIALLIVATLTVVQLINKPKYLFNLGLIAAGTSLLFFTRSLPASATPEIHFAALGASDTISEEQEALEEELKLDPGGGHYTGLEYPEKVNPNSNKYLGDQEIQNKVESMSDKKVIVAVTNGSVRLTGRAKDKYAAHDLVEDVKGIPGVREVTFDFSLEDIK